MQSVAYRELGELQLSNQAQQILQLNFPKSEYLTTPWVFQDMPWYSFWRS
jgi:outer membrane protein assembly factor BamD